MDSLLDLNCEMFVNNNVTVLEKVIIDRYTVMNNRVNMGSVCVRNNIPSDISSHSVTPSPKIEQLREDMGQLRGQFSDFMSVQLTLRCLSQLLPEA